MKDLDGPLQCVGAADHQLDDLRDPLLLFGRCDHDELARCGNRSDSDRWEKYLQRRLHGRDLCRLNEIHGRVFGRLGGFTYLLEGLLHSRLLLFICPSSYSAGWDIGTDDGLRCNLTEDSN